MASFLDLINQIVKDFDEIYTVVRLKGAEYNSVNLPKDGNTGIPTAEYANIINDNLFKIEGLYKKDLELNNGVIKNKTGLSSSGALSIDYSKGYLSISNIDAGYYDNSSEIRIFPNFKEATILDFELNDGIYTLSPGSSIISSVKIPKATFSFIEASEGADKFIQVETGGYVPSGFLVDLEGSVPDADYAEVNININDIDRITNSTLTKNYYSIKLGKGEVNAGYISDLNGEVVEETIKIAKGSVRTSVLNEFILQNTPVLKDGKYLLPITSIIKFTANILDGYIKAENGIGFNGNLISSGTEIEISSEEKIEMQKAELDISASEISGEISPNGFTFSEEETAYAISQELVSSGDSKINIAVSTPGYIDKDYTTSQDVNLRNSETKYLIAGKPLTINQDGSISIKNNFSEDIQGDYTISVDTSENNKFTLNGKLTEGYYKSDEETTVTANVNITELLGDVSVKHGSVEVSSISGELNLNADGILIHSKTDTDKEYSEIKISAENISAEASVIEGYIKNSDISGSNLNTNITSDKKYYIEKYSNNNIDDDGNYISIENGFGTPSDGNTSNWVMNGEAIELSSDKIIIQTENKYLEKNISVSLAPEAIGKNTRGEIYNLEQRLAGNKI